jgi:hypothetical protein
MTLLPLLSARFPSISRNGIFLQWKQAPHFAGTLSFYGGPGFRTIADLSDMAPPARSGFPLS